MFQKNVVTLHAKRANKDINTMIGFTKHIEFFHEDKYRDLDYGTIYYVAGSAMQELNDYVLSNAERFAEYINTFEGYWLKCKIVYLDADNSLFPKRENAAFYSAILPEDNIFNDEYYFLAAIFDKYDLSWTLTAFQKYLESVGELIESALDYGKYNSDALSPEILKIEHDGIMFSLVDETPDIPEEPRIEFSIGNLPYGRKPTSHILDELEKKPKYTEPSRLVITTAPYNFLLPDYDNIEFPFGPQIKALYLLFLTHPEGIRMKEIEDYKEEYKQLYFLMTTRSDIDKIRASVEKLMDVCSPNIISVKKSQCNTMIREALPDIELSKFYEIIAHYGQPHKINLDRSLVIMPDILRAKD